MFSLQGAGPGDIVGFSGDCLVSGIINLLTYGIPGWSISHLGVLGEHDGRLLLFESTSLEGHPCVFQKKVVAGTQAHEIEDRVACYGGKVWHYPLAQRLNEAQRGLLTEFLTSTIGLPYDYIGAFRTGGLGFSWLESRLRPADLSAIFCSEWCCAAHNAVGIFQTDNVSRWNPNHFVRTERRQGILQEPQRWK